MRNRKTHEQFKKEVFDRVGNEYTVLGEYERNDAKILMRHNTCGHEWETTPSTFVNKNRRCPLCSSNKQKAHEDFKKEVLDKFGSDYILLNEYKTARSKLLIKHNTCGHEWETTSNVFLRGKGCPKCAFKSSAKKRTKTHEKFKKEVFDRVGNEYTVLGEYKKSNIKILMRHNICGHEWDVRPSKFINQDTRCPLCAGKYKKSNLIENVAKELKKEGKINE